MIRNLLISSILMIGGSSGAFSQVLINEVASQEPPSIGDWIEFYVATSPADLSGWKVYEQNSLVKTFPSTDFSVSSGSFLVLHFNSSSSDELNEADDSNSNGAIDLYTADSGLTGTSNVLTLRNDQGFIMDAVVFTDSSSWTSTQQSVFNLVVTTVQWNGIPDKGVLSFADSVNIVRGIGASNSIGRNRVPADSNSNTDWHHYKGKQTPGFQNPAIISCPESSLTEAILSEVAPSLPISSGGDFIEIYIRNREHVCGLKVFEGEDLIKTLPLVTPNSGPFGSFIVLHASIKGTVDHPDETDASGDLNRNGAIDLYSDESSPGITGSSDNSVSLESPQNLILDYIALADRLPLFGTEYVRVYDRAAAMGAWQPICLGEQDCYDTGSIQWTNSTVKSVSKKAASPGEPIISRPSNAAHWEITSPSPGSGPQIPFGQSGGPRETLMVSQSPFSPLGDGSFSQALIHCSTDEGSKVTLKIFDIQGRLVRTLALRMPCNPPQVIPWDGKNTEGTTVPMGIYVVWMEVKNSGGDVSDNSEMVVVGRQL